MEEKEDVTLPHLSEKTDEEIQPRNNRINDYRCVWVRTLRERRARQKIFTGLKHDWRAPRWLAVQLGDTWSQLAKPFNRGGKKRQKNERRIFLACLPNSCLCHSQINCTTFTSLMTYIEPSLEHNKKNRSTDILTYYSWKSLGINKNISNGSVLFHHVPGPLNLEIRCYYFCFSHFYSIYSQGSFGVRLPFR